MCPTPPSTIPFGAKHGDVYETGFHVTYTCQIGYRVAGPTAFSGWKFVTIICGEDRTWSVDVKLLKCQKVSCGGPLLITNSTVTITGIEFNSVATYTCKKGHFIDQYAFPRKNEAIVKCTADGTWKPRTSSIYCDPFNCSRPSSVKNSSMVVFSYSLGSKVKYHCNKGFVVDHGEDGLAGDSPLHTTTSSTCNYPGSWQPPSKDILCTLIQCPAPIQPRRAYIKGGRWRVDGMRHFRYQDNATLLCAHGYYIKETDGFTDEATCTHNGTWTKNLTRVQCVDITCPDPGWKLHSVRDGTILRYMSRIQYTCDYGYFIKPGIVKITLQCTYDAHWTPSDTFTCQEVDCGDPGVVINAVRFDLSGEGNYSMGTAVRYECLDGFHIAKEQDAIGDWITGEEARTSQTLICKSNGRWQPRQPSIHCTELTTATTLYDLIPEGELVNPAHDLANEVDKKPVISGRLQSRTGEEAPESSHLDEHHTELFIHCEKLQSSSVEPSWAGLSTWGHGGDLQGPRADTSLGATNYKKLRTTDLGNSISFSCEHFHDQSPSTFLALIFHTLTRHLFSHKVLVIHHLGHWVAVTKDSVETAHIPELLTDVGVECEVYSMFDGESDTYWLPIETPLPPQHHIAWKGWVVTVDLKEEHVVGSFRLHTSANFENDVKVGAICTELRLRCCVVNIGV
ncbi:unnamed protein product [Clavelina lepadiformis]|uniref:Sushi domain-containing protein n=1 Tax=Clavelina lepadiformis TaxID=159417 RepID=A0ABP0GQM8_CLALP